MLVQNQPLYRVGTGRQRTYGEKESEARNKLAIGIPRA